MRLSADFTNLTGVRALFGCSGPRAAETSLTRPEQLNIVSDFTFGACAMAPTGGMWYLFQGDKREFVLSKFHAAIGTATPGN